MSSPTPVTDFDAALEKDWKLVESSESVIDQVVTEIRPLTGITIRDEVEGPRAKHTILSALLNIFFDGKDDKETLRKAGCLDKHFHNDQEAFDLLMTRVEETAQRLHDDDTDEESKKEIHRTHFAKATFAILTVKLHLMPDSTSAHKIYFERRDLAAERKIYAKHFLSLETLPKEAWKKLEEELGNVSVWTLGKEMESEMKKISDNKEKDTIICKVLEIIEKVSEDSEEKMENGGDDRAAKMLLSLSGLVEEKDLPNLKEPFQKLLETSQRIFEKLQTTKGSQIQDLRKDDTVFEMVMLATWWARYAELFFKLRQAILKREETYNLEYEVQECLKGPYRIVCPPKSIENARSLVKTLLDDLYAGGKKRKAVHGGDRGRGGGVKEKKPRRGGSSAQSAASVGA